MLDNTFPVALPGAKADTLMWANPWEVEHAALDQLRNISRLPWVAKVRAPLVEVVERLTTLLCVKG